jgi:hypothetical protein
LGFFLFLDKGSSDKMWGQHGTTTQLIFYPGFFTKQNAGG